MVAMIDVKQAVQAAADFVAETFADEQVLDARLEEVELSEDEKTWFITLSFLRRRKASSALAVAVPDAAGRMDREYKILAVDSENRRVRSMKIRQLVP
jgi:hypothetical protein